MVETPGIVVACPHCSIHLTTPDSPAAASQAPAVPPQPTPTPPAQTAPTPQPTAPVTSQPAAPEVSAPAIPEPAPPEPAVPEIPAFQPAAEIPSFEPAADVPSFEPTAQPAASQVTAEPADTLEPAPLAAAPSDAPVSYAKDVVSKKLFVFVLSYASAMTIIVILLLVKGTGSQTHDLESLPDIKPPMIDNKIGFHLVPNNADMPKGHVLKIGDEQRFGSVKVTAFKVTKEPIEFVHFSGSGTRDPSAPVYKLWLRFENVSDDQVFAPLDRELTLMRKGDGAGGLLRSNTYLGSAETKAENEGKLLVYDLKLKGSWDFKDCCWVETDSKSGILQPGEVIETYIPTVEEGVNQLNGDLIWRVQFRKGYNRQSKRGVTTVIEVTFNADELTAPGTSA